MNARLNPANSMTKQQKRICQDYIKSTMDKEIKGYARRLFKLMCLSLNETEGFGKARCQKIIKNINAIAEEHEKDEVYWSHVDRVVIDQIGISFER